VALSDHKIETTIQSLAVEQENKEFRAQQNR
jgi:hypothetical protein